MKKVISFILALLFISSALPLNGTGGLAAGPASPVVINQVYGAGTPMDGAISHSFIELYNTSDSPVSLNGYSIQTVNALGSWETLALTGKTIAARSSFLIVATKFVNTGATVQPRYTIPSWDMAWDIEISNRAFSVALVDGQTALSAEITEEEWGGVLSFVSALNTAGTDAVNNYQGAHVRISKQVAARRIGFADTGDNGADFEGLDYRASGISDVRLTLVRPRASGDGAWDNPALIPAEEQLAFSKEAGMYASGFSLELTTGYSDGTIRYTTNGSAPTSASAAYSGPVAIANRTSERNYFANIIPGGNVPYTPPTSNIFKGTVIKAQVFSEDGVPLTEIYTKSYIIGAQFHGLPVVSVSANEADFFDNDRGIYKNPHERGADWERPCYMEFFEPDGSLGFSQNMGVRTHGGISRNFPQKSLRFYARSPVLNYDLFDGAALALDGTPIDTFQRFITRSFGNDGGENAYMRDAVVHRYSRGLNFAVQDSRFAVVLLNGEFWGLYEIRERIDEHFVNSNYKLGDSNAAVLENQGHDEAADFPKDYVLYGEMNEWFADNPDLSDPKMYAEAQRFIDIDNVIDYYIVQTYANNLDWPANNVEIWRYQTEGYPEAGTPLSSKDGRWRYILKDLDQTYGLYGQNVVNWNQFTRMFDTTGNLRYPNGGDDFAAKPWATAVFRALCTNGDFVKKFINRYCDLMNTHMKPSVVEAIVNDFAAQIAPIMSMQYQRWGAGQWWGGDVSRWRNQVNEIKAFNNARQGHVIRHMIAQPEFKLSGQSSVALTLRVSAAQGHIRVNDMDITAKTPGVTNPGNWSGNYFTGTTQTLTAVPASGYQFEKFIVGTAEHTQNPLNIPITGAVTVQAVFSPAEGQWANPFDDVSADDWFYDAVAYVYQNDMFAGYTDTTFAPLASMTRAMFVTVIHKIEGRPAPAGTASFTDIPDGMWYTNSVLWAAESGIVAGYDGAYRPDRPITRQEAAVMLVSYAEYKGYELPKNQDMPAFSDAGKIDWWAERQVRELSEAGVIPAADSFRPAEEATRAELAEMFMLFLSPVSISLP
ncbi:MAG: CotH kinase family protein [Oscillospiraceae bacterium]|jgi:hypothetical protein|nr:CotH kinase family protein [Oscillospiraceae bacterium]